ncbi:MAG: NAD(P)H-hydrate epimerase [Planctomycetia bacterium]
MRSLTREQVRAVDLQAIGDYSLPGIVLMENAGRNAAHLLMAVASLDSVNPPLRVAIACGRGNNGGDGFVMARHLENLGAEIKILLASDPSVYRGDAAINHAVAVRAGIPIDPLESAPLEAWSAALAGSDWIVDALLGTGSSGAPRGAVATAIRAINLARDPHGSDSRAGKIFAVDIPSGLDCDTGLAADECVRADVTATFVARKIGFDIPGAGAFTGTIHVIDIGVPRRLLDETGAEG